MSGKVLIVDSGSEALRFLVCRVHELELTLARERESRKQAEAALRALDRYLERRSHNYMTELSPIRGMVRAALSKPVQEPAERESGK